MSSSTAVPRTAPIAIAPKPLRLSPRRQNSTTNAYDTFTSSMNGHESADSDTPSSGNSLCDFCAQRRIKCVMTEDEETSSCVSCQANGIGCSLNRSPQPRKRKLARDLADDGNFWRGSPGRSDNRRQRQHQSSLSSTTASNSLIEDMANFGGPALLKRTLDYTTAGHEHQVEDVDEIERLVAPNGRKLIDLYFRVVHPSFPIIQKNVFYERYERDYREFSPPLLAAIYILAINWWDLSEELSATPRPDVREIERIMRSSLADAMWRPKLSTVQAGLLLSQKPEGDQWAPTAQLVAIAQELGLHLDCTHWKIPPWEKGLRKRLAWALYMQDKWGALVHGRPSHIFSNNWIVQPLLPNDFPEAEYDENDVEEKLEIERGRTLFVQMVYLSQVLAEILETFYTLQAMHVVVSAGPQGTHLVLSLAKPIQLKLKEWYSAIPANIRMDSSLTLHNNTTGRLSSIGYLHLAYFATEITLHRRIIRSLEVNAQDVDSYLQHICRSAAKARLISAMDFVNRLTPQHLRAFWYFASKTNFALIGTFGSMLWATAPGREEADWYRRRLGEYRWTLSVSSKPGEGKCLTEFAMGMLDISAGLLKQLPEKPELSRSGSALEMSSGRRESILAMTMDAPRMEFQSDMASADVSGAQSPGSQTDSSDEMYDNFAPTGGLASMRE
ncbi:hypothetical protein PG994_014649 [Apiospora phragmitis]|uniref:Uncharacterized protein n=1 Tax=Apiospora phragmitis TaxID=2905665 RepID=A0ABR1SUI7_9PEZI